MDLFLASIYIASVKTNPCLMIISERYVRFINVRLAHIRLTFANLVVLSIHPIMLLCRKCLYLLLVTKRKTGSSHHVRTAKSMFMQHMLLKVAEFSLSQDCWY